MKIKLFIDFDSTIFDTELFRARTFEILAEAGYSFSDIEATFSVATSDYCYSIDKHLRLLGERNLEVDTTETKYLLSELFNEADKFVFNDAIEFLEQVDRSLFEVNLLTLGDPVYQHKKIDATQVARFFDHIYVANEQKWFYLTKITAPSEFFVFIDDRGDAVNGVAKAFPQALTIELNRIDLATDPMEPSVEYDNVRISNFFELAQYIRRKTEAMAKTDRVSNAAEEL